MNKFLTIAAAALFFAGCQSQREKNQAADKNQATIDSLQRVIAQSNNESEDMAKTIQQIREGFRQINEAESRVTVTQAEGSDRQVIIENMAFIQQTLKLNRQRIADLHQQLRNANQTNKEAKAAYEAMVDEFNRQLEAKGRDIEELRQQLAEKDIQIAEQGERISELSESIENLAERNAKSERTVAEQDKQMHTAWYAFGTKKELRAQNILEKNDAMCSSFVNKEYFTETNTRDAQSIKLYSKSAELKTSHPKGSYSLDKDAQGQYTLRITNPEAFWSVSRYLVVVVK